MSTPFLILVLILVLLLLWAVFAYNRFVTLRNRCEEGWSDVEVQMQRRYNLIPNLVSTVQAYMKHEATTLEKVTAARTAAMRAGTLAEHAKAENMLSDTLKSLFAVSEAYPDLKANQNFLQLQDELRDAEDKIMSAWRFYNSNVREYDTKLDHFPANIIGSLFRFQKKEYFDIDPTIESAVKAPPRVQFS